MKKVVLTALFCVIYAVGLNGQWLSSHVYDQPLKDVLNEVSMRFGVTLEYKEKTVKGLTVASAPWRFTTDLETTLENILIPLDLRYLRAGEGRYEIKKWEYYRQSDEEGEAQLDLLWNQYGADIERWEKRKAAIRSNIISVLGIGAFPRGEMKVVCSGKRNHGAYNVENIALEMLPGVWVCGSLYTPSQMDGKIPFMLCPHGHFYNKEDNSIPNERGRYRPDQQYRCATLAMMGAASFSYDMWAWGESEMAFTLKDHRTDLGLVMQTWQSIRILDYFCSMDWIDGNRVGVTGASGGGTQAMIIAAIDDRISLSVPVVMTSSHFYGGCPCESGLPIHILQDENRTNNAELCAMVAPGPQLVISDGCDWTSTVPVVEYPYLKKIYGMYGKEKNVANAHFAAEGHDYGPSKRKAMYDFVADWWDLNVCAEDACVIEEARLMRVFDGKLPEGSVIGSDKLREMIKQYK